MKTKLLTIVFTVLTLGTTFSAKAEICIAFSGYCDGLEVTVTNGQISGYWRNTDCAGTDVPISGYVGGGLAKAACSGACVGGSRYGWIAETTLDGTMDMYSDPGAAGSWSIWISGLAYTTSLGPCPFSPLNVTNNQPPSTAR